MSTRMSPFCPFYQRAVEIIGRRWTGVIIRALLADRTHFSEITATVPGLSDRLLAERLKELEAEGIVRRTVAPETPVRIEYDLTSKGRALADVVEAVSDWAHDWLAPPEGRAKGQVGTRVGPRATDGLTRRGRARVACGCGRGPEEDLRPPEEESWLRHSSSVPCGPRSASGVAGSRPFTRPTSGPTR
ncbi:MAG: winged helix-turn-helix transcriptional regulator [Streptosporangiaceae bacterium]